MTSTPPNETKSAKSKKITKFSQNDKKKKTLYAIIRLCLMHQNTNFKKENVMKKTLLLSLSLSLVFAPR